MPNGVKIIQPGVVTKELPQVNGKNFINLEKVESSPHECFPFAHHFCLVQPLVRLLADLPRQPSDFSSSYTPPILAGRLDNGCPTQKTMLRPLAAHSANGAPPSQPGATPQEPDHKPDKG